VRLLYKPLGDFLDATLPIEALEKIAFLKKAYDDPNDGISKESAHAAAESIRNVYGYSGGGDGSKYIATNIIPSNTVNPIVTPTIEVKQDSKSETVANDGFGNVETNIAKSIPTISPETANDSVAVFGGIALVIAFVVMVKAVFK